MPWRDVVGLTDEDFKRYEEHRRLIRIVAAEPYREALSGSWERLLMPLLSGLTKVLGRGLLRVHVGGARHA
jgi:hypothetical protein